MGDRINDGSKDVYVLNDYKDDDYVNPGPAEYVVIYLYFITLTCDSDITTKGKRDYMVLDYSGYIDAECYGKNKESIWSVPYITFPIHERGMMRSTKINSICKVYQEQLESKKEIIEELELQLLYRLGIFDCTKVPGNNYIEYKRSTLQPDRWKCYYIQEYFLENIDPLGLLNLADPEGLGPHRYFPLTKWWWKDGSKIVFQEKYIPENIGRLIETPVLLKRHANSINREELYHSLSGYLFKIDITGFTGMFNKILENGKSLDATGREISSDFIARIANIFERQLQEVGVSQYTLEGDGITGAIPCGKIEEGIKRVFSLCEKLQECFTQMIKKMNMTISLRCTILYCTEYTYGKLSGLDTMHPGFSGEALIVLSRMDQCLHKFIYSDEGREFKGSSKVILGIDCKSYAGQRGLLENIGYLQAGRKRENFRGAEIDTDFWVKHT